MDCSLHYKGNRQVLAPGTWLSLQGEPQFLCLESGFATYSFWGSQGGLHGMPVLFGSSQVNHGDSLGSRGSGSRQRDIPEWVPHRSGVLK